MGDDVKNRIKGFGSQANKTENEDNKGWGERIGEAATSWWNAGTASGTPTDEGNNGSKKEEESTSAVEEEGWGSWLSKKMNYEVTPTDHTPVPDEPTSSSKSESIKNRTSKSKGSKRENYIPEDVQEIVEKMMEVKTMHSLPPSEKECRNFANMCRECNKTHVITAICERLSFSSGYETTNVERARILFGVATFWELAYKNLFQGVMAEAEPLIKALTAIKETQDIANLLFSLQKVPFGTASPELENLRKDLEVKRTTRTTSSSSRAAQNILDFVASEEDVTTDGTNDDLLGNQDLLDVATPTQITDLLIDKPGDDLLVIKQQPDLISNVIDVKLPPPPGSKGNSLKFDDMLLTNNSQEIQNNPPPVNNMDRFAALNREENFVEEPKKKVEAFEDLVNF